MPMLTGQVDRDSPRCLGFSVCLGFVPEFHTPDR